MEGETPGAGAGEAQGGRSTAGHHGGQPHPPPRLRERWEQVKRYRMLGQEHLWGAAIRDWSLSRKMGFWADVVARVAQALDAAPAPATPGTTPTPTGSRSWPKP